MANEQWYFSKGDNQQQGPVSVQELSQLAESGELGPDDLIWKEGMDEWLPAGRLKGLKFAASSTDSQTSPEPKPFDAESIKSTFREAGMKANEAAGFLWFLDLKFNRFVSVSIIRVIWTLYLALVTSALVLGIIGGTLAYPFTRTPSVSIGTVLGVVFLSLMFRVFLETIMVIFRMAEHLRTINEKLESE